MLVGYTAFLDVLGFSALIGGDQNSRVEKYLSQLKQVFDADPGKAVDYIVFSDSIILTTRDGTLASLEALLSRCAALFGMMLATEIPMRGAISHGSYVTEKTPRGTFVAGKAIIDAYNFEKMQDWIGIMLAPSVLQAVSDLQSRCQIEFPQTDRDWSALKERLPWAACVQPCAAIPFHSSAPSSESYEGYAIVPVYGRFRLHEIIQNISRSIQRLSWLKSLAPDPRAQAKYDRTMRWLDSVVGMWSLIERRVSAEKWPT